MKLTSTLSIFLVAILFTQQPVIGQEQDDLEYLFGEGNTEQVASEQPKASEDAEKANVEIDTPVRKTRKRSRLSIEEIVVTAQKREEGLQDVPISVAAFTADELDARGITTQQDSMLITPGLTYESFGEYSIIYIRGVGTDAFIPSADPSVATYVDGVYFPFASGLARELDAVERIEVLKGPQGTLFGRNSTGGAIHTITRDPSQEEVEGNVQVSMGSFNEYRSRLFFTGPISDTVSASMATVYNRRDEDYKLTPDADIKELQDHKDEAARLKVMWRPVDWFDATISGWVVESEGSRGNLFVNEHPSALTQSLGGESPSEDYEFNGDIQPMSHNRSRVGSLTMNLFQDWFDVKSITAYQSFNNVNAVDFDGTNADIVGFNVPDDPSAQMARVLTSELQFISNDSGWLTELMGKPFEWIFGLYYIKSTAGFFPVDLFAGGLTDAIAGGVPLPAGFETPALDQFLNLGIPVGGFARITGLLDTDSTSVFFQSTWEPLDWLAVTVGGRFQEEDREVYEAATYAVSSDGTVTPLFIFPEDSQNTSNFSPKVVLEYTGWEDNMVFLSYSKGFKSGTFNVVNVYNPPGEVDPEETTTWELGTKTTWLDGRLRLNAAIFQNTIEDLQVQGLSLPSGGVVSLENAAEATIEGMDFDLTWAVTDDLFLLFAGAYLDGIYDSFPNANGYDENGVLDENMDFTGNKTTRTPKYTANLGFVYTMDLFGGLMELASDVYYNDGYFYTGQNSIAEQESYHEINARVSYLYEPWNTRITAYGKNLNDTRRYLFQYQQDFGVISRLAPKANYGLRINWDF